MDENLKRAAAASLGEEEATRKAVCPWQKNEATCAKALITRGYEGKDLGKCDTYFNLSLLPPALPHNLLPVQDKGTQLIQHTEDSFQGHEAGWGVDGESQEQQPTLPL